MVLQGCSLLRSKSCQADIEKLLDSEDAGGELIGDFTKVRFHRRAPACARRFGPQAEFHVYLLEYLHPVSLYK